MVVQGPVVRSAILLIAENSAFTVFQSLSLLSQLSGIKTQFQEIIKACLVDFNIPRRIGSSLDKMCSDMVATETVNESCLVGIYQVQEKCCCPTTLCNTCANDRKERTLLSKDLG